MKKTIICAVTMIICTCILAVAFTANRKVETRMIYVPVQNQEHHLFVNGQDVETTNNVVATPEPVQEPVYDYGEDKDKVEQAYQGYLQGNIEKEYYEELESNSRKNVYFGNDNN